MVKQTKKTNPILISLIQDLKKKAYENEAPIWKDIAIRLERSSRNWPQVNLDRIDKHIKENETALIPGNYELSIYYKVLEKDSKSSTGTSPPNLLVENIWTGEVEPIKFQITFRED